MTTKKEKCKVCQNVEKLRSWSMVTRYRTITMTSYRCPTCGDITSTETEVLNEVKEKDFWD